MEKSFLHQCKERFGVDVGEQVWEECNQTFDRLPLAAIIDHEIFCIHGGFPRPVRFEVSFSCFCFLIYFIFTFCFIQCLIKLIVYFCYNHIILLLIRRTTVRKHCSYRTSTAQRSSPSSPCPR